MREGTAKIINVIAVCTVDFHYTKLASIVAPALPNAVQRFQGYTIKNSYT